jgi:low temperature requirement protein LtrA
MRSRSEALASASLRPWPRSERGHTWRVNQLAQLTEPAPQIEDGVAEERRTTPVELLWDLVFVFAITQVTALLYHDPTWTRFGESMLVLALMWWAWSAFVWAANAQAMSSPTMRLTLLLATIFIFVTGLAVPHAFGREATVFATTYAIVRFLHLALYIDASRQGNAAWSAIAGFAVTVVVGMALLVAGSFLHGAVRATMWTLAVAIDYAGPAWLTRERLRGLQQVAVAHFAERYGLFVIICLGESIVAIGVPAASLKLGAAVLATVSLGLLVTVGMWWTYFDRVADTAEARLREHDDPVLAAADAYSYLHLVLVAGIILFAVGVRFAVGAAAHELHPAARLALCGGPALYLVGHLAFRWRILGEIGYQKGLVALAMLILFAVGGGLPAWALAAGLALLIGGLCALETRA